MYRNKKVKQNIFQILKVLYETRVSNENNRAKKIKEKGPTIMVLEFVISLISNQLEEDNYSN